jgi:hypothetical protein
VRRASVAVVGAYLCVIGAVVHRHTTYAGGIDWPWGLALVVGGTYAVVLAAEQFAPVGGAWLGLGWSLALVAQHFSPGGSYLVASDWLGWGFTVGSLGAIVAGVVWPPRLRP